MKERYKILQDIVKKSGKTQEEFANSIGLKKAAFNNYIKGRRDLPNTLMESLAKVYNINPAIFFDDTAPYSLSDIKQPISATLSLVTETTAKLEESRQKVVLKTAQNQLQKQLDEENTSDNKIIPLVGKSAANPDVLEYCDTDIEQHSFAHVPEGADCAINIQGDSMDPLIKNGSIVFYKKQCDVESGEIAIVEIDGDGVTCKKLIKDYDKQRIILRSINKKYDDRVLKSEEIRIIGKVVM